MFRVISLILILCLPVMSQQQPQQVSDNVLRIRGFGGLNTIDGDLNIPVNMFRQAINIDWSRNAGSVTRRYGYDSVTTIAGQDSLIGIYGAYYSDGSQQLFVVSDSLGVGYGNVYLSAKGTNQLSDLVQFSPTFRVYNSYTYVDTFIIGTDTQVVSFTSDGSATIAEVNNGIKSAIANNSTLNSKIDTSGNVFFTQNTCFFNPFNGSTNHYRVVEKKDDINATLILDTAQTICSDTLKTGRASTYFSIADKPYFTMYNDNVIITTPSGRGIIWDGNSARDFPTKAPGQPIIIPIYDTGYGGNIINGEVVYSFEEIAKKGATTQIHKPGVLSQPITVRNGRVLITDFSYLNTDSVLTTVDTLRIVVRRGTNLGSLDDRDSLFLVDTLGPVTTAAGASSLVLIDSLFNLTVDGVSAIDKEFRGRDSVGILTRLYGAPEYISSDSGVYTVASNTDTAIGIYHGISGQRDTLGVVYAVSFIDTSIGIESPLGPSLSVWVNTAQRSSGGYRPYEYRLSLPLLSANDSGLVRNLYRAQILQVTRDSVFNVNDSILSSFGPGFVGPIEISKLTRHPYVNRLAVDSVIRSPFYLVSQISTDSLMFTDSTRWDSLQATGRVYNFRSPPLSLSNTFSFDGRIWGTNKSTVLYSRFDSAAAWGLFDRQVLGSNNGESVTLIYPSREVVVAKTQRSSYNIFKSTVTGTWDSRELSSVVGCIAPRSYAKGLSGHYYLSEQGVIRENDGQFLNRTQVSPLISKTLKNFDNLSLVVKSKAEGFYADNKYMLSIGDSLYVYDEKEDKWSVWLLPIGGATLYGSESERSFLPGDTMYFFKPGDTTIFRYKTAETDGGAFVQMMFETGPLFADEYDYSIDGIGVFGNGESTDLLQIALIDHKEALLSPITDASSTGGATLLIIDSLNERYRRSGLFTIPRRWFRLKVGVWPSSSGNVIIDGIDVEYTRKSKKSRE